MTFLSRVVLSFLLATSFGPAAIAQIHFVDQECRCSFVVPSGWIVETNLTASLAPLGVSAEQAKLARCAFWLRPSTWPPVRGTDDRYVGSYAVEVRVSNLAFQQAARDAFFEQVEDLRVAWDAPEFEPSLKPEDWLILGRQASRDRARWIKSDTWFGLYGEATVGYYGPNYNGYRGMDTAFRAVVSNRRWRAATFMGDNPYVGEEFMAIVRSFRFEAPGDAPPN